MNKKPMKAADHMFAIQVMEPIMSALGGFIYFGTLLGFVRDGSPIENDDDVDLYFNQKYFNNVLDFLTAAGFCIDRNQRPNNTDWFLQARSEINGRKICVDFYFYDSDYDDHFVIEPWNFWGTVEQETSHLRTPKALLFPLKKMSVGSLELNIPAHPVVICEFLYGVNWRIPLQKGENYVIPKIIGGRPLRVLQRSDGVMTVIP